MSSSPSSNTGQPEEIQLPQNDSNSNAATGDADGTTSMPPKSCLPGYSFYMWGVGSGGGDNPIRPRYIPNISENYRIQQLSCGLLRRDRGDEMAYVLTTDGNLHEWNASYSSTYRSDRKSWYMVDHNDRVVSQYVVLENVTSIVSGQGYHVATTSDGKVYMWGIEAVEDEDSFKWKYNTKPQHIGGFPGSSRTVQIKQVGLGRGEHQQGEDILDGCCVIALSTQGYVYSWGKNQFGMTGLGMDTGLQEHPTLVAGFGGEQVVQIATFNHHSGAVTASGSLYTWGCGSRGQLGHGNESNCLIPTLVAAGESWKIDDNDDTIKQVACGNEHTLVLTNSGKVYAFGINDKGQIGQGREKRGIFSTPTLLSGLPENGIVKVSCGATSSYAITRMGEPYGWGSDSPEAWDCTARYTWHPKLGHRFFRNQKVEDIQCFGYTIAALVKPQSDYVPLSKAHYSSVFDDEFSDVSFVVENETIPAHRIILARRCEYFHKMFTSGMRESVASAENNNSIIIPIPDVSKNAFLLFLHYLYTGEIEVQIANVLELYRVGDMYGLPRLQDICANAAETKLSVSTAARFLQHTHDCNCEELKQIGMDYVRDNFAEVSQSPGMEDITAELMLEIVKGYDLVLPEK